MADLPTGTVTFLFTDIEGSTKLWEKSPRGMQAALTRHDALLWEAIEGTVVSSSRLWATPSARFSPRPSTP